MGLLSKLMRPPPDFAFSDYVPSEYLTEALQEAESRPLDEFTWRIVVASPRQNWIVDVTLFQADAGFTAYARGGIQKARRNAVSIVQAAVNGTPVDEATLATAALAFFDTEFTVGANKGKTGETAWNTLALDVELRNGKLLVARSAHSLNFPFAPLLLDYERVLDRFR